MRISHPGFARQYHMQQRHAWAMLKVRARRHAPQQVADLQPAVLRFLW
jgi:hypothetical protein